MDIHNSDIFEFTVFIEEDDSLIYELTYFQECYRPTLNFEKYDRFVYTDYHLRGETV